MSIPISTEKRMLTATEFEIVEQTHYPAIFELPKDTLSDTVKLLRNYRNKARDRSRQQRREMRGKSEPRGSVAARDNTGTERKGEIFASALKRVNRELSRIRKAESRKVQGEYARRALEMKRRNRVRHHPSSGRSANAPDGGDRESQSDGNHGPTGDRPGIASNQSCSSPAETPADRSRSEDGAYSACRQHPARRLCLSRISTGSM